MREKLNGNPVAQVGIVLVLLIAVGYMVVNGLGGEEESAPTEATVAVAGTGVSGTAVAATPGAAVEGAIEAATAEVTAAAVPVSIPAPPLPKSVSSAYDSGKTVVLLVVHDGGIDDRHVARSAARISALPDVAFFKVPVAEVSRYAAITMGVEVDNVPALVVVRPKDLSEGVAQASVTYGYQSPQAVVQAVRDASYDGPPGTYYPK